MRHRSWTLVLVAGICLFAACSRDTTTPATPATPATADAVVKGTKAGDEKMFSSLAMKFCWCPAGKFTMGSPKTEEGHFGNERQVKVTLTQGFWMGKYEVTQEQYEQVMGPNPSHYKGDNLPVEQVSWNDATDFCRKLTEMERTAGRLPNGWEYKLPTEAQWEYACRAGTTTAYSFGDDPKQLVDYAWYMDNAEEKTHAVGQKKANAWGLHDMHGNVWEWCNDWYGDYPNDEVTDPTGRASGSFPVLRGGSWDDPAWVCRSSFRRVVNDPAYRDCDLGFRLARSSVQPAKQGRSQRSRERKPIGGEGRSPTAYGCSV